MLQKLLLSSLVVGFITGIFITFFHLSLIKPIIDKAEVHELSSSTMLTETYNGHHHSAEDDSNQNHNAVNKYIFGHSLERTIFSFISNIIIATGFSFLFSSVLTLIKNDINIKSVFIIGFFGFLSFCLLPSISLSPQPPGTLSASLELRQFIWVLISFCSIVGLAFLFYKKGIIWRIISFVILIIPHIIAILVIKSIPISNVPSDLISNFVYSTIISGALLWFTLSILMNYFYKKL